MFYFKWIRVDNQVNVSRNGQVASVRFELFPVAVIEALPLWSHVNVLVSSILNGCVNEIACARRFILSKTEFISTYVVILPSGAKCPR